MPCYQIIVEGGIGVGKTTFLNALCSALSESFGHRVEPLEEPVSVWQNFGATSANLLDDMYKKLPGSGFRFQMLAILTKLKQIDLAEMARCRTTIMERGLISQKEVFIPLMQKAGELTTTEVDILDLMFRQHQIKPDATIYLLTDTETCLNRIAKRARSEEAEIDPDYIEALNERYRALARDHPLKYRSSHLILDASLPVEENVERAINWLNYVREG